MKIPNLSYPFILFHLAGIIGIFAYPPSMFLIGLCLVTYMIKLFFISAGYHRYFAHKSFKMNRFWQFIFAFMGATAAMKSALWWASGHRYHHKFSDQPEDLHTPVHNPWLCHGGWVLLKQHTEIKKEYIQDFLKYPELLWLHKYNHIPLILSLSLLYLFWGIEAVIWGGVISSLMCWHAVFIVNSLSHIWGSQPYKSGDQSRNNWFIALLTMGEGWHNNHHYYPYSANIGFVWWQFDMTYYGLLLLEKLGVVSNLHKTSINKLQAYKKSVNTSQK